VLLTTSFGGHTYLCILYRKHKSTIHKETPLDVERRADRQASSLCVAFTVTTKMSAPLDLTMDDSDNDIQVSDSEERATMNTTLKRKMSPSTSIMDDDIGHSQLQASIEKDVLLPALPLPNWGSGDFNYGFNFRVTKPFANPAGYSKDITPSTSLDSEDFSTRQSSQTSRAGEFRTSDDLGASKRDFDFTPASIEDEDLQMSDSEPQDFPQHPSKRPRFDPYFTLSTPRSASSTSLRSPRLDPDIEQEIIWLEEDEAAEAAEAVENEASTEFMHGAAVDELDENFNIIDLSLDGADDGTTPPPNVGHPHHPEQDRPRKRQSSIRTISNAFSNLRLLDPIASAEQGGHIYKPSDSVEFHNGTFMRIKLLRKRPDGKIILSGPLLTRHYHHCLDSKNWAATRLFPEKHRGNEVIWTVTIESWSKQRQDPETVDRELAEVMRPREIVFTNQTWPCTSSRSYEGKRGQHLFHHGPLYCRWKRIKQVPVKTANRDQEYEDCIERLGESEADPGNAREPWKLRFAWRRKHVPPGGGSASTYREVVGDDGKTKKEKINQPTFADCFCGCGGASKGAELAECAIKWSVDFDEKAARSYLANFSSATCHQEDIFDFLSRLKRDPAAATKSMVDILHMSPPCQAFSLARTTGSIRAKEIIEAVLTSTGEILELVKPRIATMEETAGLLYAHKDWLSLAIREMVVRGYSVRWKIMKSEQYGVPQLRKRLVVIAAGPGEALPPWPKPTHGNDVLGLKPLATINDVIQDIPRNATHQEVISQFKDGQPRPAFDGTKAQAKTLTCGGGIGNYHPSGRRPYTIRERACLQTFPVLYSYANANLTTATRQIGNAFPPFLARAVYREVVKTTKEADMKEQMRRQEN
jgi:DNA (cytosine-5)-methyltransferase 1